MSNATRVIDPGAAEQLMHRVLSLESEASLEQILALCLAPRKENR
jgi:hypothetical protein